MAHTDHPAPPLCLEGELNIYTAAEVKLRLLELLNHAAEPQLDLSGVTEVDTAGLQLLILVHREAERLGKPLRYLDPSPAVLDILNLCHLTARLAAHSGDPASLVSHP